MFGLEVDMKFVGVPEIHFAKDANARSKETESRDVGTLLNDDVIAEDHILGVVIVNIVVVIAIGFARRTHADDHGGIIDDGFCDGGRR